MFWNLFWPIALITLANCFYNICTKSTPEQANPFLSLCVTYLTAAAVCISVFLFSQSREAVSLELSKLNWTAPTLGLAWLWWLWKSATFSHTGRDGKSTRPLW